MAIAVERDALLGALRQVVDIVAAKNTIPVLGNTLVAARDGVLTITTTNLDQEASTTIPCEGEMLTTAPALKLLAAVSGLRSGKLKMAFAEGRPAVTLSVGSGRRTLSTLPPADFPLMKPIEAAISFALPGSTLRRMLDATAPAMEISEARYWLCGVYLRVVGDELRAAATDGFVLVEARAPAPVKEMDGIIIPAKGVAQLRKLLSGFDNEIAFECDQFRMAVTVGATRFTTKLIDASYPGYQGILDREATRTFEVVASAFGDVVAGVAAVVDAEGEVKRRILKMEIGSEAATVSASDTAGASAVEEIPVSLDGEPITVELTHAYLRRVIGTFADGAALTVSVVDERSALTIRSDKDADLVAAIQPVAV